MNLGINILFFVSLVFFLLVTRFLMISQAPLPTLNLLQTTLKEYYPFFKFQCLKIDHGFPFEACQTCMNFEIQFVINLI